MGLSCAGGLLGVGAPPMAGGGDWWRSSGPRRADDPPHSRPTASAPHAHKASLHGPASSSPAIATRWGDEEATPPEACGKASHPPPELRQAAFGEALAVAPLTDGLGGPCQEKEQLKLGDGPAGRRSRFTSEMKTLFLTAMLFLTITFVQFFGAAAANSQALMMDCICMGVDGGTMFLNMGVEALKGNRYHQPAELFVGAVSLLVLIYFTLAEMVDSIVLIKGRARPHPRDGEEVDPYIVMWFSILGICVDIVALAAFYRSHRKNKSGREMNMWTALLHVGADCLRSTTTMVLSLILMYGNADSVSVDAWASIVVAGTILSGAAAGVLGWCRSCWRYVRGGCCLIPVARAGS